MRGGVPAPEALKRLLAADAQRDVRQVAMIDAQGRVDAFTGRLDIKDAGHHVGAQYSVQANMMANARVWPAMAAAFENDARRPRRSPARRARGGPGGRRRHPRQAVRRDPHRQGEIVRTPVGRRRSRVRPARRRSPRPDRRTEAPRPAAARVRAREPRRRTGVGEEDRRGAEGIHGGRRARARDPRAAVLAGGDAGGRRERGGGRADLSAGVREGALLGRSRAAPAGRRPAARRQGAHRAHRRAAREESGGLGTQGFGIGIGATRDRDREGRGGAPDRLFVLSPLDSVGYCSVPTALVLSASTTTFCV